MKQQEIKKGDDEQKLKPTTKKAKITTKSENQPAEKNNVDGGEKVVGEEEKAGEENKKEVPAEIPAGGLLMESCCWDVDENWPCYCLFCAAVEQISWGTSWWSTAELMGCGGGAVHDHLSAFSSCDDVPIWEMKEFDEDDFNSPSRA